MGDGALRRLFDAAGDVEVVGAVGQAHRTAAARFAARLLGAGVEVEAGGGEALLAAGAGAVEIDAFAAGVAHGGIGTGGSVELLVAAQFHREAEAFAG